MNRKPITCKFLLTFLLSLFTIQLLDAQMVDPIQWTIEQQGDEITFSATVESGWHLYGTKIPEGGPYPTIFVFEQLEGATLEGEIVTSSPLIEEYSDMFELELNWYVAEALFVQKLNITDAKAFGVAGYLEYQACNDEMCLPPTVVEFHFGKELASATTEATTTQLGGEQPSADKWWQPVTDYISEMGGDSITTSTSLWLIFLSGFLGGLLALLTPCVWPMIPMTVSFFLKRTKDRKRSIADALVYGFSIVVIYLLLGLLITAVFGASALNSLATNALFNLIFFALLVVFAISFFGAFEIALPASWTTKMDSKADTTTGFISIFFMAFTLVLVSFSCTGPIIGTLLVQAATMGSMAGPAIGMTGFALALAIPFALFAIFPSWLKQMPKSGGWLNSVKVVLGFLELALSLKFLSVADLAYGWGILDREVFLVLWIVIFAFVGFYLLGKLKFSHDSDLPYVSVPRLFMAIVSFAFAIYMVPGLWGAPLKAVSAFAPPLTTQDFNLYEDEVHAHYDDYDAAMAYAAKVGKPVMVDFSGFGCVNCRKMEATVWTDSQVKEIIENDYVLVTLMVDDKTPLPQPIEIEEYGKKRTLRTVGDKWSYLQRYKFGANAQPYYVLLDNEAYPLVAPSAYDENVANYIDFLQRGVKQYNAIK